MTCSGMSPPAAIIFDLDGTLVDSVPHSVSVLNAMLTERGSMRRITASQAWPFASLGGEALIAGLLGAEADEIAVELAEFRRRYASTPTAPECLYPGVRETLAALAGQGIALAICSNKPQNLCEKVLDDLDLASFFRAVVGSAAGLPHKPAPDMLELTLHRLCLPADACILVGDSAVDVALAATCAMPVLFLESGYGDADERVPPHRRFADFVSMAKALRRDFGLAGQMV